MTDRTDTETYAKGVASEFDATSSRYSLQARVLESFVATLDVDELLHRIISITLDEFGADRAWLLHPVSVEHDVATVAYEVTRNGIPRIFDSRRGVPLESSREIIRAALATQVPVISRSSELDPRLVEHGAVCSQMAQLLRPDGDEMWAFGVHLCQPEREWSARDAAMFREIGRYATLAINNAQAHRRAIDNAAKLSAILDQIPEAAAIYNDAGELERLNAAAMREAPLLFGKSKEGRLENSGHRHLDGRPVRAEDDPALRALNGETVRAEFVVTDPRTSEERNIQLRSAPIRSEDEIIGSVVLARDVTEERQKTERETWRRRRADALATIGLELVTTISSGTLDANATAKKIATAISGNAMIYFYQAVTDHLHQVGAAYHSAAGEAFAAYLNRNPYRSGEGLPGTVFQVGRPLLFAEVRGDAIVDFARNEEERAILQTLGEQTVIATPIEAYGERVGALVISRSDDRRHFDAEDLEFAQAVADRIGAAAHVHRLTRIAQEGHRAAEELARREVDARARFEAVLETAPVGIAVVSADELRFEMANPLWVSFAARYGRISEDTKLVGLRVDEVIPGEERELKVVAERGETRIDNLQIGRGERVGYYNRIISPVRGRFSGTTQSLTVLVQDVTDQIRAKREIEALAQLMEERSARLDSILGSMTDGLWVYDVNANVIDVNQAAVSMFGLASRSDAVAHGSLVQFNLRYPDGKPIPPADLPYARALRGEVVPDYLAVGRHKITGKDLDLSIAVAPIESNGIVGAVLVMRDITALQELDRKKDEFLSVASHELRTPLTTIKGYTQLLAQTINDLEPADRTTYLGAVLGEVERMMGLISELLDVSRIETNRLHLQKRVVQWSDFLERQVAAFRVQNPKREIALSVPSANIELSVDPDRMRQVVDNLLSNALKYSPEGSPIEVVVSSVGENVSTAIVDHGIGIPKDELPQLFERFHRARNVSSRYYGGLGLGLYIARAIVEAHGGRIAVTSEEGTGSTFTLLLPR